MQERLKLGGLTNALSAMILSFVFLLLALYTSIACAEKTSPGQVDYQGIKNGQGYYRARRLPRALDTAEQNHPYQRQHAHIVQQSQQGQGLVDEETEDDSPDSYHYGNYKFLPPVQALHGGPEDELGLLDICLLASVDGKFHALNRTSGQILWSMGSSSKGVKLDANPNQTKALDPLVRTQHFVHGITSEDSDSRHKPDMKQQKDMYIIEPQTGAIFILPETDAPLQRLPFTMAQLVDMSPFTLPGDDEHRVFVGRKETSLVVLELETGKLKSTVNSECPWDPFAEMDFASEKEADFLDELENVEFRKNKPVSTEILIGRTDYHVSIHTRPRHPFDPRPPVQTLTFSTYGPNNQDHAIQATYRRAPDDIYIQPMANGEVMAFKTMVPMSEWEGQRSQEETNRGSGSQPLWGNTFGSTVVAVFDILRSPSRKYPIALLQPQPRIHDVIPNFPSRKPSSGASQGVGIGSSEAATYIGLVPESQALFALSVDRFPLAATFSRLNYNFQSQGRRKKLHAIDGYVPSDSGSASNKDVDYEEILEVDTIDGVSALLAARARCENGFSSNSLLDKDATESHWDLSCLVGKRPVVASGQSRLGRLLPDRASDSESSGDQEKTKTLDTLHYGSGVSSGDGNYSHQSDSVLAKQTSVQSPSGQTLGGGAMTIILIVLGLWYITKKKPRVNLLREQSEVSSNVRVDETGSQDLVKTELPVVEVAETGSKEKVVPSPPKSSQELKTSLSTDKDLVQSSSYSDDFVIVDPRPSTPTIPATPLKSNATTVNKTTGSGISTKRGGGSVEEDGDDDSDREDDGGEGEAEGEKGALPIPGKKKPVRRRKRGRKNKGAAAANATGVALNLSEEPVKVVADEVVVKPDGDQAAPPSPKISINIPSSTSSSLVAPQQLDVSDDILGYGSHGTVVFRGSLQGRAVAVKRLLQDFVTLASREVMILQESDDHPNVIRYYYQEAHGNFLYIALELCPASLADVVEHPDQHRELAAAFEPKRALAQIASGLRHLHALKIIHRDIKPQNILISSAKKGAGTMAGHRMLISDFGLCKRLEVDQTSFLPTAYGAMAAGTAGWRAPEILRGDVKLDEPPTDDSTQSSRGSVGTVGSTGSVPTTSRPTRLTKSVDIFALGCLFYYILTSGGHPFGDRYEREINILKDEKSLSALESFGEEGLEAIDLITSMLNNDASKRPDTTTCLIHPFFWNPARRLGFLQDASDRFEIMCRDPRDPNLVELERYAHGVVGNDWQGRLDKTFLDNLGKFRKYDGKSVQDLMRALRNKKHHYQDLPDNVKRQLGPLPDGFLSYFTRRFPHLFMHVHNVIARTNLRYESMFKSYFELTD